MTSQAQPKTEERLSRLEGGYEQVNERLNDLTQAINSLRSEVSSEVNSFRAEVNARFNNMYIIMGGSWVSLMAAIIASNFLD